MAKRIVIPDLVIPQCHNNKNNQNINVPLIKKNRPAIIILQCHNNINNITLAKDTLIKEQKVVPKCKSLQLQIPVFDKDTKDIYFRIQPASVNGVGTPGC